MNAKVFSALSWIRCCSGCGRFDPPIEFFCEKCLQRFFACLNPRRHVHVGGEFTFVTLIDWKDSEYQLIKAFVAAQKQGRLIQWIRPWLESTYPKVCGLFPFPPVSWVPIPSRAGFKNDHSFAIAESYSLLSGVPIREILRSRNSRPQKFLKREARSTVCFLPQVDLIEAQGKNIRLCVVDDVVTTGSTFKAACEVLPRGTGFGLALVNRFDP